MIIIYGDDGGIAMRGNVGDAVETAVTTPTGVSVPLETSIAYNSPSVGE